MTGTIPTKKLNGLPPGRCFHQSASAAEDARRPAGTLNCRPKVGHVALQRTGPAAACLALLALVEFRDDIR
jgi:hypothetical protein